MEDALAGRAQQLVPVDDERSDPAAGDQVHDGLDAGRRQPHGRGSSIPSTPEPGSHRHRAATGSRDVRSGSPGIPTVTVPPPDAATARKGSPSRPAR